jgi:alkaline phosphatase D
MQPDRIMHPFAAALLFSAAVFVEAEEPAWLPLPKDPVQRIAFGSCAKHWQHQPIWDAIIEKKPDLFLFLGDNIYADTDGTGAWEVTGPMMRGEWNRLADKPEFQKARAAFPFLATWDNHDYGSHAGGVEFPVKEESRQAFLDFFGEPADSPRRQRSGIYDAKIIGPEGRRLQIILLDTKYNRSAFKKDAMPKEERIAVGKVGGYLPNPDPTKTHLGDEQWAWLETQLKEPADLRLLCSSIQIIPDQKGMNEWANFPHERQRLLDLARKAGNVILLSGNVHFAEISRDHATQLTELTSSGMTHINKAYADAPNRHRLAGPFAELNFGLITIDWEASTVDLVACAADGTPRFNRSLSLNDLARRP